MRDGSPQAGMLYHQGVGIPRDEGRAEALFEKSCEGGVATGCTALGTFYLGKSPQDAARASREFRRGCEAGDGEGCAHLATLTETGLGVPKDLAAAKALYKRACGGGHIPSCERLKAARR